MCYLTSAIKDVLLRCRSSLMVNRGQRYDGAPNNVRTLDWSSETIQDQYPSAVGVHCLTHNMNLVIQDVTNINRPVKRLNIYCFEGRKTHLSISKEIAFISPDGVSTRFCPIS